MTKQYSEGGWLVFGLVASTLLSAVVFGVARQIEYYGSDLSEVRALELEDRQEHYRRTTIENHYRIENEKDAAITKVLNSMFFRGDNPQAWAAVSAPSTLAAVIGIGTIFLRDGVRATGGA